MPALWLSFPVAVALVQLRRQTLLGWFLLLGGFTVVAVRTVLSDGHRATVRSVAPDGPGNRDRDLCRAYIAPSHAVTTNLG